MRADEVAARRVQVIAALLEHKTERRIAADLGVSNGTIHRDIKAIRAEWQMQRLTVADEVAAEDLQRLGALEAAIWGAALRGDHQAIDRALKIMERRAKMLGIDAPTKIDITERIRRMAEENGMDPAEAVREAELLAKGF